MRHIVVGTAGHIDHGKSALVKALTGTDPDRLKEERERGITIDLGFAHLDLAGLQVAFVDVPGHERFVRNMLAGVGGIDFVLLVVAADESVMPQTREHFDICRLLGIQAGIVTITKTDLVDQDLVQVVREEIRDMAAGSFLERAEVIAVSAKSGAGLPQLREAMESLGKSLPYRSTDRPFRLPIDRVFSMRGFGTVVTGTLIAGRLRREQEVMFLPGEARARVRGIQVHGLSVDEATAGQRTAVNLQGVELGDVDRGVVLTAPGAFRATRILDSRLTMLPGAKPLKNLIKVRFHHGTSEVLARVALIGRETVAPGESAYVQLRLDQPVFCLYGDAFIIRQFSPTVTIGGGRVLNPAPLKHKGTDLAAVQLMERLDHGALSEIIPAMLESHTGRAFDLAELNSRLGLPEADLRSACGQLVQDGALVIVPAPSPVMMLPRLLKNLESDTVALVREFHRQNPLQRGMSREELRTRLYGDLPPDVFRFCLDRLTAQKKLAVQEETVSLYGREVQLSAEGLQLKERIEAAFRTGGFRPPALSELAGSIPGDPEEVRKIYFWMLKEKILVRISDDLAYHSSTLDEMKQRIQAKFSRGAKFGVADFKDMFDLTRKHAIPLLEFFDRERLTRRQGNDRVLL